MSTTAKTRRRGDWPPAPEPLPLPITDNHTHLDVAAQVLEKPLSTAAWLDQASAVNIHRAVQIGCDLPGARWTAGIVHEQPGLLGGVALHPNEAPKLAAANQLDEALAEIAQLAQIPRIRVVGETGMDTYRTGPEGMEAQRESFRAHIQLAKELDLVLQIHDRNAHAEVLEILKTDGAPKRTVFHCFSGDAEMAQYCADQGWYLSFAGTVTFKNAGELRRALAVTPLEQIMVETDAPFLTPHPHRGAPNSSYLLPHTVRTIAEVLDQPLEAVCERIEATTEAVYGPW
ncbi:MAG TPA: TatD family hydrolase [Actinomycetales bacterium]|nr:TatD family hydrolase [Actinomycetales bacterium]